MDHDHFYWENSLFRLGHVQVRKLLYSHSQVGESPVFSGDWASWAAKPNASAAPRFRIYPDLSALRAEIEHPEASEASEVPVAVTTHSKCSENMWIDPFIFIFRA